MNKIKIRMFPDLKGVGNGTSGVAHVVINYHKYLPDYGIELVTDDSYDLIAAHAGATDKDCDIAHCHGLYWTADYQASNAEHQTNMRVINAVRHARETTVPSEWVAEAFQRDMRFTPHVIYHGVDWQDWQHKQPNEGYVLWNKERANIDVCDPTPMEELARQFSDLQFVSTFANQDLPNIKKTGRLPHAQMKKVIQRSGIYLSLVKETFGIGTLEALASGKPVLGWAHGGNLIMCEHGVNSYLAHPGDYDDLKNGLEYIRKNYKVLSANARETAKAFTWQLACEKVAAVYRLAMHPIDYAVSVVIPCYNYGAKLPRAVKSVIEQTLKTKEIIIVDDGSTDDTHTIVNKLKYEYADANIIYVKQDNKGVAHARNKGIDIATSEFICCLDADDAIAPTFLQTCVDAHKQDRSLGIAYTSLLAVTPDGSEKHSAWPYEYDGKKHFGKSDYNAIPTCNVFKKEAWRRVGGYNQRFAPSGAGSEDADFWIRILASGYTAKLVTKEPLFIYSFYSGTTSHKDWVYVDWKSDKPYVIDKQYPFAAYVPPENNFAHPVRQYDEPIVSVIIPVGPGHENLIKRALDSIESQSLRKWEAIVVNDSGKEIDTKAYPYVRMTSTSKRGGKGAGFARNRGVDMSRAPFVVFLDADDWLSPDALERMMKHWNMHQSIIYSDYVFTTYLSEHDASELKRKGLLREFNGEDKKSIVSHNWVEYDCEVFQQSIRNKKFFHWCLVTCLVPKQWHYDIGGFDEAMQSWEDVDYYWRMAWQGKCFKRLDRDLVVYQFDTGTRRSLANADDEIANDNANKLIKYMIDKLERIEPMACRTCGGAKPRSTISPVSRSTSWMDDNRSAQTITSTAQSNLANDLVKVVYMQDLYGRVNKGSHQVLGTHPFDRQLPGVRMKRRDGNFYMDYGRMGCGTELLIHRLDYHGTPHRWRLIEEPNKIVIPEHKIEHPQAPKLIGAVQEDAEEVEQEKEFDLSVIPGVTPDLKAQLDEEGITSIDQLRAKTAKDWEAYKGIGAARAKLIVKYLNADD